MTYVVFGAVVLAASAALTWHVKPHEGQPGLLDRVPVLAATVPMAITIGVTFGITLVALGLFGRT
jgi:hypothetical protein